MVKAAQYVAPGKGKSRKSNQADDSLVEQKVRMVQSLLANKGKERTTKGGTYSKSAPATKLKSPAPEVSQSRWPNESLGNDHETRPTPWVPPWAGNRK